jgi:predicted RNase H-like HicB family nuclease
MRTFTVFLSPELETGGYSVTCPAMPGAVSQGEGREKTLRDIQEAMELRLEASPDGNAETPLPETPTLVAGEVAWVLEWRAEEDWPLVVETATITLPAAVAA